MRLLRWLADHWPFGVCDALRHDFAAMTPAERRRILELAPQSRWLMPADEREARHD